MSLGLPGLAVFHKKEPVPAPGPPFAPTSANNGDSVDSGTGKIVLGQGIGAAGDPAELLSNREIPFNDFTLSYVDRATANELLFELDGATNNPINFIGSFNIDLSTIFGFNQNPATANFLTVWNDLQSAGALGVFGSTATAGGQVNPDSALWESTGAGGLRIAATNGGGVIELAVGGLNHGSVAVSLPASGNLIVAPGAVPADNGQRLQVAGGVSIADAGAIVHNANPFNDGAGAQVGTLANAPAVGNPTKWIPIDDAGVIRFIPAW